MIIGGPLRGSGQYTGDRALVNAIPDNCASYDPDKTKHTPAKSQKLGIICDCKNFIQGKFAVGQCIGCQIFQDKMIKEELEKNLA